MALILKKTASLLLLIFISVHSNGQHIHRSFNDNIQFVQYLQDKEQYQDAIIALNGTASPFLSSQEQDTLNYFKGWNFYNLKLLDSSVRFLLKVRPQSGFYLKSRFFGGYNYIYLQRYDDARHILDGIPTDSTTGEMIHFEKAGIALLQSDYEEFDTLAGHFSYALYALSAQERNFSAYKDQLLGIKKKSPLLAGIMSAIIPGSGKIYAGKTYQGIASMLPIAALALLTNESYHKRGSKSGEFYFFGSLLTVFYVGNIWGSVFSVKINREEHEKLIHQKILFDLQIPLRTVFN